MCEFCMPGEKMGDMVRPLIKIGTQKVHTPEGMENFVQADAIILEKEGLLNIGVYLLDRIVLCEEVSIRYCPMCGRKLPAEE